MYDSQQEGTESEIPTGNYETRKQEDLKSQEIPQTTDKSAVRYVKGLKIQIEKSSSAVTRSVKVKIDVEAENQKAEIARLNQRLRKLRSRK